MSLSNITNNEKLYLLGYTINYIEEIMKKNNGSINLSTPLNFVFLFAGDANSEIAIIEQLLKNYPIIRINNIYLISNYDSHHVANNTRSVIVAKFSTLLLGTSIHPLTFKEFNILLLENTLFRHNEKVLCFSINSQIVGNRCNNRNEPYEYIGLFYRIWFIKYKRHILMLGTDKTGFPIKISNNLLNWNKYSNVELSKYIFTIFYGNKK